MVAKQKIQGTSKSASVPDPREKRQWPRVRVLLNARLATTTDEQPVKIRDVSQGGVMLEGFRPVPKGRDVVLRRGEMEFFARVAWVKGNECGLQFDDPLTPAELQAFVHQPPRAVSPLPELLARRPDAIGDTVSAEQWALNMAQSWGRTKGRETFGE